MIASRLFTSTKSYDLLLGCSHSHLAVRCFNKGMITYVISTTITATAALTASRRGPVILAVSTGGKK